MRVCSIEQARLRTNVCAISAESPLVSCNWRDGPLKSVLVLHTLHLDGLRRGGSHQVEHAAQHGQQQEGSLGVHAVDGAHHRRTGGRHPEDERPDGVQVKLRGQDAHCGNTLYRGLGFSYKQ